MVLFADRTPRQRAQETDLHPATVRTLTRRFRQQGMVGLLPEGVEVMVRARARTIGSEPDLLRVEIARMRSMPMPIRAAPQTTA